MPQRILTQREQWPFRFAADDQPAQPVPPPQPPSAPTAQPGGQPASPQGQPAIPSGVNKALGGGTTMPLGEWAAVDNLRNLVKPPGSQAPLSIPGVTSPAGGGGGGGPGGPAPTGGGGPAPTGGPGANQPFNPGAGVEQWRSHVEEGLRRNGLPTSYADQVLHQMQTESSGNPNAINQTDSNAQAGHPSQGLMQTIPSTFQQYHLPGDSNEITDPQANIDSAINYALHTYGPSLMNQSGGGMGSGHGY